MRVATGPAAHVSAPASHQGGFADQERSRGDLGDVVTIVRARRLSVAIVALTVLAVALIYLVVAPRVYTGAASILIDARSRAPVGDGGAASLNAYPDAILVESQVRLIASDSVLRRVAAAEKLDADPEFVPSTPGLRSRLLGALGLGGHAAPEPEDPILRAIGALASRISVKRSERTYIADIEVKSRDPAKAARLANAVANAYFADQQAARNEAAARDSDWVLTQVAELQAGLQAAETRAEVYRRDHGIIDVNGKMLTEQNLSESATGLVQARAKVAEAKARYDQIERVIASGRPADTLPDALKSPSIDKLRSQYAEISRQEATLRQTLGTRHPALLESDQQLRDVRRLIAEEIKRIEVGLANEYQTAQANIGMLESQVQSLKAKTVTSNGDRVKLDELQRDVDARRAVYDRFLRARDTVKEQAADTPIGRLIAPANIPTSASSPKTVAVLSIAAMIGLLLGLGTALVGHTLEGRGRTITRRIHGPAATVEEVSASDITIDGVVPSPFGPHGLVENRPWRVDRMRALWPTAGALPGEPADPAFRAAIAALPIDWPLDGFDGAHEITTLLVSSEPGNDARTPLALGIAARAAELNLRAIVIDLDSGRSLLRDLIEPGAQADVLELMGITRMCYWAPTASGEPIGLVPKLADQARVTQRMRGRAGVRQLDGVRGHFDVIVFDGPAVTETERLREVASSAQQLIFVAASGTARDAIEAAMDGLELPPALTRTVVLAGSATASETASVAA